MFHFSTSISFVTKLPKITNSLFIKAEKAKKAQLTLRDLSINSKKLKKRHKNKKLCVEKSMV